MGKRVERLTAFKVARTTKPGYYPDGAGLYLQVTSTGGKSWIYLFSLHGRAREMGLGAVRSLSLSQARGQANDARRLRQAGIDPIEARKTERGQAALAASSAITFKHAAGEFIASHRAGWRNAKHAAQWGTTLATYAEPIIAALPVQAIDTALVLKILQQRIRDIPNGPATPLWTARPETASRLRGRIESVLDWARARGHREGENPARWRGHLDKLLPPRSKVRRVRHHAALPYTELPAFVAALRTQEGIAARGLEFTILAVARTSETIGAEWPEINAADATWMVPAERMKAHKEHRVPLCQRAVRCGQCACRGRQARPLGHRGRPMHLSSCRSRIPCNGLAGCGLGHVRHAAKRCRIGRMCNQLNGNLR